MSYEIQKNVPMPTLMVGVAPQAKYPFHLMEVGESFHEPNGQIIQSVRQSAIRHGKLNNKKFMVKKDGSGVRVWRAS